MTSRPDQPMPARDPGDDESPGVPIFRTWRGVYAFVLAAFVTMAIALTLFTRFYA